MLKQWHYLKMTDLSKQSKDWLKNAELRFENLDTDALTQACHFTERLNDKINPPFSESVLTEGLNMANELLELNCDTHTLAAAITYPAIYYNQPSKESIRKQLGENIYKILSSAQRMEAIHDMHSLSGDTLAHKKVDNLRKMLLAIVDDVRIVLIKLAERLTIMKYLRHDDTAQRQQIADQTMRLYAPLANRLGIGQFKWQLEDLAFRYLKPQQYAEISKAVKMRRTDRERYIKNTIERLTTLFKEGGIKRVGISGRAKHIYSIYRKMKKKDIAFKELYDASAFRILVPNLEDCYTVLSIVHAEWPHIAEEFDDYIAKPKPNGYQSIHTAVVGPHKVNLEIQIRTYQMHEAAELGAAAHWKYKEGGGATQSSYEEKINRLREVMDWQQEIGSHDPNAENTYSRIFEDRIYVFTPNGDVFDLSPNATPLDFAYHVHSEIGHRCKGAKVNNVLVPLTHTLKTGDRVEILTAKEGKPSRDWLNLTLGYLKTNQAQSKVRHWFKKESYERNLEEGERIWEKACRRKDIKKSDINRVFEHFNFKKADDLLAAIGSGDIGIATALHHLQPKEPTQTAATDAAITIKKTPTEMQPTIPDLTIGGVGNLLTQIAKCCKPIPGDLILGYITKGRGISIHHQKCHNIQQAVTYRPERIIDVDWGNQKPQAYPVDLIVEADDRSGLVRDITGTLANENIPLLGLNSRTDKIKSRAYINLTIEIKNLEALQQTSTQIRQVPSVISVRRR